MRKRYSGQDEPGERYHVYVIDYGAYVDLINTRNEPQGALPLGEDARAHGGSTCHHKIYVRFAERSLI